MPHRACAHFLSDRVARATYRYRSTALLVTTRVVLYRFTLRYVPATDRSPTRCIPLPVYLHTLPEFAITTLPRSFAATAAFHTHCRAHILRHAARCLQHTAWLPRCMQVLPTHISPVTRLPAAPLPVLPLPVTPGCMVGSLRVVPTCGCYATTCTVRLLQFESRWFFTDLPAVVWFPRFCVHTYGCAAQVVAAFYRIVLAWLHATPFVTFCATFYRFLIHCRTVSHWVALLLPRMVPLPMPPDSAVALRVYLVALRLTYVYGSPAVRYRLLPYRYGCRRFLPAFAAAVLVAVPHAPGLAHTPRLRLPRHT